MHLWYGSEEILFRMAYFASFLPWAPGAVFDSLSKETCPVHEFSRLWTRVGSA